MARTTYQGYGITELRQWARDLKIAGRSKMDGWDLVAACFAQTRANVVAAEKAVTDVVEVKPGTLLRHKSTGAILKVTGELHPYVRDGVNYESLAFTAEYVTADPSELTGAWAGQGERWVRYQNEKDARSAANGYTVEHMLYQHEAV